MDLQDRIRVIIITIAIAIMIFAVATSKSHGSTVETTKIARELADFALISKHAASFPIVEVSGKQYQVMDEEAYKIMSDKDLNELIINYMYDVLRGLELEYKNNVYDCDDYSNEFKAYSARFFKDSTDIPMAVIETDIVVMKGDLYMGRAVKENFVHATILVKTETGWKVVEPQNGNVTDIEENQLTITNLDI